MVQVHRSLTQWSSSCRFTEMTSQVTTTTTTASLRRRRSRSCWSTSWEGPTNACLLALFGTPAGNAAVGLQEAHGEGDADVDVAVRHQPRRCPNPCQCPDPSCISIIVPTLTQNRALPPNPSCGGVSRVPRCGLPAEDASYRPCAAMRLLDPDTLTLTP